MEACDHSKEKKNDILGIEEFNTQMIHTWVRKNKTNESKAQCYPVIK